MRSQDDPCGGWSGRLKLPLAAMVVAGLIPAAPVNATVETPTTRPRTDIRAPDPWQACRTHIRAAETRWRIPPNLLAAIARVESGRRDSGSGDTAPWPWTINANGEGRFFPTKAEAIQAVRDLQSRGVKSIDIGCMQINISFHPAAFQSIDDAFDPQLNVEYGARFLINLFEDRRNWTQAATAYHSNTPVYAEAYQQRLMLALPAEARQGTATRPDPLLEASRAPVVQQSQPALSVPAQAPAIAGPAEPGGGRSLFSYRANPIPIDSPRRRLPVIYRPSAP